MISTERQALLLEFVQEFQQRQLWFGETVAQEVLFLFQELGGAAHYTFRWDGWMPTCSELVDDLNELRAWRLLDVEPWHGSRGPSLRVRELTDTTEVTARVVDLYQEWPFEPKLSLATSMYLKPRRDSDEFDKQMRLQFPDLDPAKVLKALERLLVNEDSQELQPA